MDTVVSRKQLCNQQRMTMMDDRGLRLLACLSARGRVEELFSSFDGRLGCQSRRNTRRERIRGGDSSTHSNTGMEEKTRSDGCRLVSVREIM